MANISNVLPRLDTTGAIMDMHDGNMVVRDGTWYWYAAGYGGCKERLGPGGAPGPTGCAGGFHGCGFFNNHTVNLFTSTDLVSWTPHGNVLPEANRVDAVLWKEGLARGDGGADLIQSEPSREVVAVSKEEPAANLGVVVHGGVGGGELGQPEAGPVLNPFLEPNPYKPLRTERYCSKRGSQMTPDDV